MKSKRICALICAAAMMAVSASAVFAEESEGGETYTPTHTLSNPNANEAAMRTYDYICDNFGTYVLTGQQESTWMDGGNTEYEMEYIEEKTGKLPAVRGLDFMNGDFDGVVERSKEWHEKGGIVTICWHTGVYGKGYNESRNDNPDFDKLLTEGTDEYNGMMENWKKAADALKELEEAGVTVLWRPFHEFDGQWFWWGKGGAEDFKKLWQMMYDYFTVDCELNNLIWVLGYADDVKDGWYPGDEYCDIIGSDTYRANRDTNVEAWNNLANVTEADKPLAFHECGKIPSMEALEEDGCLWSWFMTWHSNFITDNDVTNLNSVYNSERAITLDELPDLSTYVSGTVTPPSDSSEPDSSSADSNESTESTESTESVDSLTSDDSSESAADTSSASSSTSTSSTTSTTSSKAATSSKASTSSSSKTDNPATGVKALGISAAAAILCAGAVAVKLKNRK